MIRSRNKSKSQHPTPKSPNPNSHSAFTIVELLIVIVVIGILAAITIVAYNGIQTRARTTTLKSDLRQAATQLELAKTGSNDGTYPGSYSDLNASDSTTFQYDQLNSGADYCLTATHTTADVGAYHISSTTGTIQEGPCTGHSGSTSGGGGGITIGSQTWAANNLNVGTMVPGTTEQTDNGTLEKYCFDNDEANCESGGGLYQWNEAMQYSTTEGAQGICPAGWRIPTDNDWKILEMELGMTQAQADATGWRGTNQQGTQLKAGGSSGLDIPLAGVRATAGSFSGRGSSAHLWSSSESGSDAWRRYLSSGRATVSRSTTSQAQGFSVRCLKS